MGQVVNDKFLHHWYYLRKNEQKGKNRIKVWLFLVSINKYYCKHFNILFKGITPAYKIRYKYSPRGTRDLACVNLGKKEAIRGLKWGVLCKWAFISFLSPQLDRLMWWYRKMDFFFFLPLTPAVLWRGFQFSSLIMQHLSKALRSWLRKLLHTAVLYPLVFKLPT